MRPVRILLRATPAPDGAAFVLLDRRHSIREIAAMIANGGALDTVNIRTPFGIIIERPLWSRGSGFAEACPPAPDRLEIPRGYVMLVDDTGLVDGKPRNRYASEVYAAQCRPGVDAIIAGDAYLCPDRDFA